MKPLKMYLLNDEKSAVSDRVTVDDNDLNSINSYFGKNYLPVEYDYLMQSRWEKVLRETGRESTAYLYDDGTFYKTIYADKPDAKVKFGVLGAGRGLSIMEYCESADNAELTAVCDSDPYCLNKARTVHGDKVKYFGDFDEFLKCDLDIVVLANYGNEHAPFAIKALNAGKNVFSELLPVQTMKEAVELVEAVERSGKLYIYGENCCYMYAPRLMTQMFREGKMGEFQYGEGEYLHNCEKDWHHHSHSERNHWRNTMSAFYYCTHSLGPLIRMSGKRPVSVTGFEAPYNKKMYRMGAKAAPFGVEMVTLENGAIIKSLHGVGPVKYSLWFSCQGEMGVMESGRNILSESGVSQLYADIDSVEGADDSAIKTIESNDGLFEIAKNYGHDGSDYYLLYNACEAVKGNKQADIINVYEALDMFLPGMFAYFSVLNGNVPMEIPDLRKQEDREKYRNDTRCTDPKAEGNEIIPSYSKGNPDIPDEIYQGLKAKLLKDIESENKQLN